MKVPLVILCADEATANATAELKLREDPNQDVQVQKLAKRRVRHRKANGDELTIQNTTGQEFWVVTIVD